MEYTLKELRTATGMTQKEFGEYFGIPHRTIQNWEGGQRECPKYLLELMIYKLENEKKLNKSPKLSPVIDKETWEAAQAKMREKKQSEQPPAPLGYNKMREKKQSEQPPAPLGYKWQDGELVIDETEAEKVRVAFEKFIRKSERKNSEE